MAAPPGCMPPLGWLWTFVKVAEAASLAAAAAELGRSRMAISQQLANLGRYAGVELFAKAGRRKRLTADGEALLAEFAPLLRQIERCWQARRQDCGGGGVSVLVEDAIHHAYPMQLCRALAPLLPAGIRVEVRAPAALAAAADAPGGAITLTYRDSAAGAEAALAIDRMIAVGRPALGAAAAGRGAALILAAHLAAGRRRPPPWLAQAIPVEVDSLVTAAALADHGLGLALVPRQLVAGQLRAGRLAEWPAPLPGGLVARLDVARPHPAVPLVVERFKASFADHE
jgi:LysR family glycine cleavage system transcriptional activator